MYALLLDPDTQIIESIRDELDDDLICFLIGCDTPSSIAYPDPSSRLYYDLTKCCAASFDKGCGRIDGPYFRLDPIPLHIHGRALIASESRSRLRESHIFPAIEYFEPHQAQSVPVQATMAATRNY